MNDPETEAEPDTVDVCPECDRTRAYRRGGQTHGPGDDATTPSYRCRDCGAEFDEPRTRPSKHTTNTMNGLARRLADADPEEVLDE